MDELQSKINELLISHDERLADELQRLIKNETERLTAPASQVPLWPPSPKVVAELRAMTCIAALRALGREL